MRAKDVQFSHVVAMLVLCATSACTPHVQIRTDASPLKLESYRLSKERLENDAAYRQQVGKAVIEEYPEFLLSYVEFDDQGRLWDRSQLKALETRVDSDKSIQETGALIVVFTHGWFNNAAVDNGNVEHFRKVLLLLHQFEKHKKRIMLTRNITTGPPRKIIGVFVGWRGLSATVDPFKAMSFWGRKETAHRLGSADLIEALTRVDLLKQRISRANHDSSRLIIVGHSFGGTAVFSALSNVFKERAVRSIWEVKGRSEGHAKLIEGFGDLVVLVNPAFEALLYSDIAEATEGFAAYDPKQSTVLLTVGAENDSATGTLFPIGRFVSTSLQRAKNAEERSLMSTTVGNYTNFFTIGLSLANVTAATSEPAHTDNADETVTIGGERIKEWKPPEHVKGVHEWTRLMSSGTPFVLQPLKPGRPVNDPFMVIRASRNIVDAHSGIWKPKFVEFLRDFIIAQDIVSQGMQTSN